MPRNSKVEAKSTSPKKPIQKTDVSKIRALEEQLAQRDAELAVINSIQAALASKIDFQGIIDAVGDKLGEIFTDGNVGIGLVDKARNVAIVPYVVENGKRVEYFEVSLDVPSVFQHLLKRRRPILINRRFQERFGGDAAITFPGRDQRDLKSWLSVPIINGDEFIGGISLRNWQRENAYTDSDVRLLQTVANSMSVALENARLFDETQRLLKETEQRATELQIINNIGQTLTEGLDLNSTLERVGDRLRESLGVENIGISVWDEKLENIIATYYYRNGKPTSSETWRASDVKAALRLSARGGNKSWVINRNAKKSWRKFGGVNEADIPKSFVQLPLIAGGKLIGGITIADYEKEDAFTDLPINMLETIASNLGTAIQNARLFDETQRLLKETEQRATELQIINNIGQTLTEGLDLQSTLDRVGDRLRETLKVDSIGIAAFDPKSDRVIAQYLFHRGERLTPDQISTEKSKFAIRLAARRAGRSWVVNTDAEKYYRKFELFGPPKSFVMLPLLSGKEIIGGITILDYERENAFTDLPISLIETIASNMGTAIQNVRLFDETQRLLKQTEQRATELQIINNIGQTLTEGLDLQSTLERVGERLREVLEVKALGIVAFDPQAGLAISNYIYHYGRRIIPQRFSMSNYKYSMRFALKVGSKPLVVNTDVERYWKKFGTDILTEWTEIPKAFVIVPMLAGRELVGSITIADYENENAFFNLPINLLETIASNMGTAIQNVRLFDETQRLLKETEQRATELQIINNIGQTLTEGGDLENMIQRVGERICEALNVKNIAISIFDKENERVISPYMVRNGKQIKLTQENFDVRRYKMLMRAWARAGGGSTFWVVNRDIDKFWQKGWLGPVANDVPKSLIVIPFVAGGEIIGGISLADYERENAFSDLSVNLLETIASNMGTAVQNVRLFDETQVLLKETEQRATELQIINNIGQTLTESGDLESMIQRVGERIQEALSVNNIIISIFDKETERIIANYMVRNGEQTTLSKEDFNMHAFKIMMRASARRGGVSWVIKDDGVGKFWHRWRGSIGDDVPKSVVVLPLLAGREVIGGISLADYEKENAFTDLSLNLLETIASNMGTAVQNVRLFEETKRLFAEAEEARAVAEQANKAKSTFLANMSHELRTPLNAIIGFTSIVRRKTEGVLPEKQTENLDKVLSSSQHLLGLINTALDIAKIEAGRMDIIPAKFSLGTLVDQCATLAVPLLKPNVTMEKQLDENIGLIFSDQDKVKQIVLNLLSNAAKFTHAGKILLSVQKVNEESVNISVTDSGIGISKEALGRVFEEFQQADNTTTRQYGGTGLGLTISRNLARLLGGDLTATSELGKGSTFTLTLPIQYGKKTAASLDAKPDSAQSTESQSDDVAPIKENGNRDSLKTILIVEDTELNISLLTQLLEGAYNLLVAKDGAQGVSMAQANNPDLILMDISLPIMDGYEATRRIRMTMPSTPIIGLSAHAMSGDEKKAKEAGCNDYLTKPVNEDLLLQKLNQYLR